MFRILYFAWLRERIGVSMETIESDATMVSELMQELQAKGGGYALAFAKPATICVAVDQELGDLNSNISGASEIAFFPPMTGG